MDRDEFRQWADDLLRKLPDVAGYVNAMPKETRDEWFEGIFERHELRDALAVNRHMFETGEGASRYELHKLAGVFIRLLQEKAFERNQREQTHKSNRDRTRSNRLGRIAAPAACNDAAYRFVVGKIREHKQANNGQMPSDELVSQWTSEYLDEHDTSSDEDGPRYKCHRCRDTGWLNYQSQGRVFCGCCPECDRGRERSEQRWRSGRTVGFAPSEDAEANPFNASLAGLEE